MKKLLGISLVAILTATPLMAGAETTAVTDTQPVAASTEAEITAATTNVSPKYKLKAANNSTDGNAASAGYVKGAYNAAIKAINKVDSRVDTISSAVDGKQDALTAGAGINIDESDKITVDYETAGGLELNGSGDSAKLQVKTDGTTVGKDATSGALKVVAGGISSTELATSAVTNEKLADNAVQTANILDSNVTTAKLAADAVTNAKLADNAVQTENILNGTILVEDVNSAALVTAGNTNNDKLTTQGYVDTQISGINTTLQSTATQTGVATTIKNTDITVTPTTTNLIVMTDWADDTTNTSTAVVTGVSAAIDPTTVSYTETLRTRS